LIYDQIKEKTNENYDALEIQEPRWSRSMQKFKADDEEENIEENVIKMNEDNLNLNYDEVFRGAGSMLSTHSDELDEFRIQQKRDNEGSKFVESKNLNKVDLEQTTFKMKKILNYDEVSRGAGSMMSTHSEEFDGFRIQQK
jgi:hypothetical protein